MIKLEKISKSFAIQKKKIVVFENISEHFESKKIYALTGSSGSGKSTLLNLIAGLDFPDHGKIFIKNKNICDSSENALALFRNKNIGFIFQQHCLIRELTVLENILLPAKISQQSQNFIQEQAKWLLGKTQLTHRSHHLVGELSGGEMQRASVARALINKPSVILADEPTGNLDEKNAEFVFSLIHHFSRENNATILIATHNKKLGKQCDFFLEIKDKKLTKSILR